MNNIQIKTYSPSNNFCGKLINGNNGISIKEKKMMLVEHYDSLFSFTSENVTVKDEGNYTKVEEKSSYSYDYYLCLESDCKYVCEESSYDNDGDWYLYRHPCYKKESDFASGFNDAYNLVYNNAKKYDPTKSSLRRSLLEERDNDKKETSSKGYYYEDAKEGNNGYYKGYFVIDNTLTIIEQTRETSQAHVQQLKLVLKLDDNSISNYYYINNRLCQT